MTLSKQLVALIAALLLLVFSGTFFISVQNTRDYLEKQLESHAQDTATSLGLSISSQLADHDLATVRSMSDAIFDHGYYQEIRVEAMDGKPLVKLILPVRIEGVPRWFIERLPLMTPVREAALMNGWVQTGRVVVQSHPGFAYYQLWQTVVGTFWWFLGSAVAILLISLLLLRLVLKPLKSVEMQADAICNREFPVQEKLPRTLDLRRIVEAMNRMSDRVRQMLDELDQLASGLRYQVYQHPVTGLANKRYFMDHLSNLISSTEVFSSGAICLIELKNFKHYNDQKGYQAGDELLKDTAKVLADIAEKNSKYQLAHLTGACFALLYEDCTVDQAGELGKKLSDTLTGLYATGKLDDPDAGQVGIGYFDGGQSGSDLFSEADMALKTAQLKGANAWHLNVPDELASNGIHSATEWRELIKKALKSDGFQLQFQPVVSCKERQLLHQEVLVRIIVSEGEDAPSLLPAGLFIPQAESHGLASEIEKVVISKVLQHLLGEIEGGSRFAINISSSSIQDPEFINWLDHQLADHAVVAPRLIFEMPEYGAIASVEQVRQLIEMLDKYGSLFSLDHFGRSFSSFAYLASLKVHCLKIDGSFMRSLDKNSDNRFFIQVLTKIAHGLEIEVIGESVESELVWDLLPSLHLDGAQGYYIGKPI